MRRILTIALLAAAGGVMLARGVSREPQAEEGRRETRFIDLKSDLSGPVAPGDSVLFFVRNFAAQHNGAVITCDSAVRYSPTRIECFGNVLINKNTTYIYGDRAEYDGELNEAHVYSDLVKVVDGDATLYTYKFFFNTQDNVGQFADGGVLVNRENKVEAIRGYYYADDKRLVAVDEVEMRNDEYELKSDSVVYDLTTDNAYFFDHTNIWSHAGDYLYADRGEYRKADTLYVITRNGYVLTEKQEMWSDSLDYFRPAEHVILRRDIQIDDTEHKVLAFGDYGEYWKSPGDALLTRDPAVISYDLSQGDSLFMRSDTIRLFTINRLAEARRAEAERIAAEQAAADERAARRAADSLAVLSGEAPAESRPEVGGPSGDAPRSDAPRRGVPRAEGSSSEPRAASGGLPGDSTSVQVGPDRPAGSRPYGADSLAAGGERADSTAAADSTAVVVSDSLAVNSPAADTLTVARRKALMKEQIRKAKSERKAAEAEVRRARLDSLAVERRKRTTAKLLAQSKKEEARLTLRREKAAARLVARKEKAERKGKRFVADSSELRLLDLQIARNAGEADSLATMLATPAGRDSIPTDSIAAGIGTDSLQRVDSTGMSGDSIFRIIKGFRAVRVYRSDFQAVCDSLVAVSTDSTIHLYIDPVLWNQSNQITSDVMDIFTQNSQIVRAEFVGSPMMVAQLDTIHYNQIAGKQMMAYFRNNQIYRNDVNGNVQTIYYSQDGEPPVVTEMAVLESGDASFLIEEKQVVLITYRSNPVWHLYPLDKVPEDQPLYLNGFKWEGARRPATQQAVFDGRIRPSERRRREALAHPDFPIQRRIDAYRARLIESGRWSDRMDQVDAETVEWMHGLGFEVGQPRETRPAGE